ncbi:MAG: lipopolysaccharide kinase InaA family protein [bacterium]
MPNLVGRRIAGRLVTDVMGMGSTSAVYRVRHVALGREEVLRVLRDEIEQERLPQVLPIVAGLRSPHGVRVLDLVPPESGRAIELDHPMLFTELAEGRSLDARPPGTQLSPTAAARIIHQVGRALQEAHHHGIAHGDLKPSNILLVEGEEGVSARVTDFGLLPPVEKVPELLELRPSGRPLFGTPAFPAPERILRDDPPMCAATSTRSGCCSTSS